MSIGLITELEVVNDVLSTTGDSPVQSLDDGYQPVFIIKKMINNISRDMQSMNYWFNTEYGVTLDVNTESNTIVLPFNLLKFEPEDARYINRGLTVYDRLARTTTITAPIVADISVMLEFNQLPQEARKFIQAKCKQQYNNEFLGDNSIKRDLAIDLQEAKINLDRTHIENENVNILDSSRSNSIAFANRRRGPAWQV